jgi:hypothetical protein
MNAAAIKQGPRNKCWQRFCGRRAQTRSMTVWSRFRQSDPGSRSTIGRKRCLANIITGSRYPGDCPAVRWRVDFSIEILGCRYAQFGYIGDQRLHNAYA